MFIENLVYILGGIAFVIVLGIVFMISKWYRKVEQGKALVRNGIGGTRVYFSGAIVLPVIHQAETMDISVKRVEIDRQGKNGLICMDNMRADIKVAFFVRVNQTVQDVLKVAQSIGCGRASSQDAIVELFDAKFSESLKTVGRQFNFVDLYNSREKLKEGIIQIIGTDLNGFVLEDVAIDYLEQTSLQMLNPDNILDSEGIKKITELTAAQKVLANNIDREREKTITKQNVEAREAILELERQQAEAEQKQQREIASVTARETAEAKKVQEEERLKSEQARIAADEEIQVAEENKNRQVIVAQRNKERTDAVEKERVEKDRALEATERERLVALSQIERDKAIEVEKKIIQDAIRQRLEVEKTVILEQQRLQDTEAFATADREKKVAVTLAEKEAEEALVKDIKKAEASRKAAEQKAEEDKFRAVMAAQAQKEVAEKHAEEILIEAEAREAAARKDAAAKKSLAEAVTAETAATGLGEVQVIEAMASAKEKDGSANAKVLELKFAAEAKGITEKAAAMKEFDGVGREHEEFKLRLETDKEIQLKQISVQEEIAEYQANVIGEALKHANIDIIGGETQFFDRITSAVTSGMSVDRMMQHSQTLSDVKNTFFKEDNPDHFQEKFKEVVGRFGMSSDTLKNLTISAALTKALSLADGDDSKGVLESLLNQAKVLGLGGKKVESFLEKQA
ncbi:MAG: flotillin family protein [Verrucomicrobia bacterium]|nr:flotillin family protein [Verrucomicrobiota bacterium]